MYTKTAIISVLAGVAAAAPALAPRSNTTNIFAGVSSHSGDQNIHLRSINASGSRFYLNKATSAYCPDISQIDCSAYQNTTTIFAYNPTAKTLSLDVAVPGGQLVYVAPNGELGYTTAHSGSYPVGSGLAPFNYNPQATEGSTGTLNFENGDFYACPVEGQDGVYQVFAAAYGNQTLYQSTCTGFGFVTAEWDGKVAWQY